MTVYEGEGRRSRTEDRKASGVLISDDLGFVHFGRGELIGRVVPFSASFKPRSPCCVGRAGKSR